jgi:UDPglucose--hexose-1-phosphate uridylyltransferase
MSEFRQNPITKAWVLLAPARNKRPDQYKTYSVMHGVPEEDHLCVFCPGNEHLNPEIGRYETGIITDIADHLPKDGTAPAYIPPLVTGRGGQAWELRVIPNKFPSLEHSTLYRHKEFYVSSAGAGDHEVIITRKHNEPVALQSIATVELTLRLFIERIRALNKHPETAYVQIFHNHGRDAGASVIQHTHHPFTGAVELPQQFGNIVGHRHANAGLSQMLDNLCTPGGIVDQNDYRD